MESDFYVYILTNGAGVLYVGMTNNIERRFREHVIERTPGSVTRHNLDRLIFYESYPIAREAIAREKQIKGLAQGKENRAYSHDESKLARFVRSGHLASPCQRV